MEEDDTSAMMTISQRIATEQIEVYTDDRVAEFQKAAELTDEEIELVLKKWKLHSI